MVQGGLTQTAGEEEGVDEVERGGKGDSKTCSGAWIKVDGTCPAVTSIVEETVLDCDG